MNLTQNVLYSILFKKMPIIYYCYSFQLLCKHIGIMKVFTVNYTLFMYLIRLIWVLIKY